MAEAELGALVALGGVPDGKDVARVRHELTAEAEDEPDWMEVPCRPVDSLGAGEIGQAGDRAEGEHRGNDEHEHGSPLDPAERPPKQIRARGDRLRHVETVPPVSDTHTKV